MQIQVLKMVTKVKKALYFGQDEDESDLIYLSLGKNFDKHLLLRFIIIIIILLISIAHTT